MIEGKRDIVAGLFATPDQAMTVRKALHRIGLTDSDVNVGRPGPGPYRLDVHEAENLGRAILDGIVVGTILGAAIGALLIVAVPGAMEHGANAILLGILMGGFWGSFFGGLGGMALKAAVGEEAGWCEVPDRSDATLVIARAGATAGAARTVMQRCGASAFVLATPDMIAADSTLAVAATVPADPGHLPLGGTAGSRNTVGVGGVSPETLSSDTGQPGAGVPTPRQHDQARAISIPRGAFLLLIVFLIALSALWANVYLRVLWRA